MNEYTNFLQKKSNCGADSGFRPVYISDVLFDFQKALVEWAILKGRAAIFADCGLGKTPMQLVWAENVVRKTNKPVLILTPLAVSYQTVKESEKFQIDSCRSSDGKYDKKIVITNYERLKYFNCNDFSGVVCDESSILKNFDGSRKSEITSFMKKVPYRLLATATAAPNDYTELGTSSEALGYLGFMDMLNRYFVNTQNNSALRRHYGEAPKWRFKGHAEVPFWRWVTSWARACRKPSDLGFTDDRFTLPELKINEHYVTPGKPPEGMLFNLPALTLPEQRKEKRRTIQERCEQAAEFTNNKGEQVILWCQLNDEGKMLNELIPDSIEVSGSNTDEQKEERLMDFANANTRVLITKPKIGAWGLNLQKCSHVIYFPSHSYEQYYQAIRRCWRFGQERPVTVDIILTEGERKILQNLKRKAEDANKMFSCLVGEMNNSIEHRVIDNFINNEEVPEWL